MVRGETGRFSVSFLSGVTPVDPPEVTFAYRVNDGATTTLVYGTDDALVRTGTGTYQVDLPLATWGKWAYRWEGNDIGDDDGTAAIEEVVRVERGEFA